MRSVLLAAALLLAFGSPAAAQAGIPCDPVLSPRSGNVLAHPVVAGSAGDYPSVKVIIERPSDPPDGRFDARLVAAGQCLNLAGPPEPADFFLFSVQSVLFTPVDATKRNGIVILYDASQIGPQHGTDHKALVYRLTASQAIPLPEVATRLDGVRNAREARYRLLRERKRWPSITQP